MSAGSSHIKGRYVRNRNRNNICSFYFRRSSICCAEVLQKEIINSFFGTILKKCPAAAEICPADAFEYLLIILCGYVLTISEAYRTYASHMPASSGTGRHKGHFLFHQ